MPAYKNKSNGTWYVSVCYTDWKGEAQRTMKRGFATKKEALEWEREFIATKSASPDMTFGSFIDIYYQDRLDRLKRSTQQTKKSIVDLHIRPYFSEKVLRDISSNDILQWQNTLLRARDKKTGVPFSESYIKTVHNQLTAMLNHAVRYYNLPKNPATIVGNPGSDKHCRYDIWTKEDYQKFSTAMMDNPMAFYAFEILYWTGIREGELLALTPEDIDFKKHVLRISKTYHRENGEDIVTLPKTDASNRVISLPQFLCDELQDYIEMVYGLHPTDRLFPVSKYFLLHNMKTGSAKVGVKRIRIHDLRHSHVSLLISMGYSAVAIGKRTGHTSAEITYRYAHMFPNEQLNMADDLDKERSST